MSAADAHADLVAALATVQGLRGFGDDPGANVAPPAALVGPPRLTWGGFGSDPTGAEFVVIVMVPASARAMSELWALLPLVTAAIEDIPTAVVRQASPGSWRTGGTELPCYEIQIEVSLN